MELTDLKEKWKKKNKYLWLEEKLRNSRDPSFEDCEDWSRMSVLSVVAKSVSAN